jgi:hypothetical protein
MVTAEAFSGATLHCLFIFAPLPQPCHSFCSMYYNLVVTLLDQAFPVVLSAEISCRTYSFTFTSVS